MHETSTAGMGGMSWRGDSSYFVGLNSPFPIRGGGWGSSSGTGLFCFSRHAGNSTFDIRFPCSACRCVVLVKEDLVFTI